MKTITEKVFSIIEEYSMIQGKTSVLCAVSGGADSVCLLHLLYANREKFGIKIFAAHYEHGIRGEESQRDAEFVSNLCDHLHVECIVEHGNVPLYAEENSIGVEEAARKLRYDFLQRAANSFGCDVIATAHNINDNAETVIFNLSRGGGPAGLRGIPPVRDNIIRPLLGVSRTEIECYLEENGLPHMEDSTNYSDDYSRNRIRHSISPVMKMINSNFESAVFRTSELLRADEDFFINEARRFINSGMTDGLFNVRTLEYAPISSSSSFSKSDIKTAKREAFCELSKSVASRVIRLLSKKELSYINVDDVLKMIYSKSCDEKSIVVPGMTVTVSCGYVLFEEKKDIDEANKKTIQMFKIIPGERYMIPETHLEVSSEISTCPLEVNDLLTNFYIKYDEIKDNIWCSSRRAGDRIIPSGRKCTKTLKQLFLEKKIPAPERDLIPVFRMGDEIAAIAGVAVSEKYKAAPGSTALHILIK